MVNRNLTKNKKGWMRLVEAFISIVLLAGVLLVVTSSNVSPKMKFQEEITEKQISMLRDIQLDEELRAEILSVNLDDLPLEWDKFESEVPLVKERIEELSPVGITCNAKICLINGQCFFEGDSDKEVYARAVIISANATHYSPRQIKLFCIK